MDEQQKAAFLAQFVPGPSQTLLGFAVMGGVFGEGVDLTGDRLIGVGIVGPGLPEDLVPYWDYDAPNIPNEPRDASAAACTASALYELDGYLPGNHYKETADKIMESLGSPAYRAEVGTNGNFILMHSVGSIPHGQEIDVPLNYADYYFLEGLMRKEIWKRNKK